MSPLHDLKHQGEVAELLFLYRAAALGPVVSKPYGESAKYDFLVDADGHLTRVQVKSVSTAHRGSYRISCGSGQNSKTPYTAADIDLLAAYIIPEDAWYLIPVSGLHSGHRPPPPPRLPRPLRTLPRRLAPAVCP